MSKIECENSSFFFVRENLFEKGHYFSTHGFNRTGLVAISYLCELGYLTFTEATRMFSSCRSGGIYRHEVLQLLYDKYGTDNEQRPEKPDCPNWLLD